MHEFKVSYRGQDCLFIEAENFKDAYVLFLKEMTKGSPPLAKVVTVAKGVLSEGGAVKVYQPPHRDYYGEKQRKLENEKAVEQRIKNALLKKEEARKQSLSLSEKIKNEGFRNLNAKELWEIAELFDHALHLKGDTLPEELELAEAVLRDKALCNFLHLRKETQLIQNQMTICKTLDQISKSQSAMVQAMGVNLQGISTHTSEIRRTSSISGMIAARHLGEQLADETEDPSEGFDMMDF